MRSMNKPMGWASEIHDNGYTPRHSQYDIDRIMRTHEAIVIFLTIVIYCLYCLILKKSVDHEIKTRNLQCL